MVKMDIKEVLIEKAKMMNSIIESAMNFNEELKAQIRKNEELIAFNDGKIQALEAAGMDIMGIVKELRNDGCDRHGIIQEEELSEDPRKEKEGTGTREEGCNECSCRQRNPT